MSFILKRLFYVLAKKFLNFRLASRMELHEGFAIVDCALEDNELHILLFFLEVEDLLF